MEFDEKLIREIAGLDDAALKDGIQRVCMEMGVDPHLAGAYLGDMNKIRSAIMGLKEEDLKKICDHLGEDRVNDIITGIRSELREN